MKCKLYSNLLNAYISSVVVVKSGSEFSPEFWDEDVPTDMTSYVFAEDIPRKEDNVPLLNILNPK